MTPGELSNISTFVVSDAQTLEQFKRHTSDFLSRGAYRRVKLEAPVARREQIEHRINLHYHACGCFEGGLAVILTFVSLGLWRLVFAAQQALAPIDIAWGIGILFLAAILGKVFGILHALVMLQRELAELAIALDRPVQRGDTL